jgi:hypothetical protein
VSLKEAWTLRGASALYRIHRAVNGPWWFSQDGSGRFDPVGSGFGACYFGTAPLSAWVEVFRKPLLLAEETVLTRALFSAELGRDVKLADVTSRRALGYGITATIGAGDDYGPSHAFAAEAVTAGFGGIRYLVRHDPAQKLYGIALFGPAGAPDHADPRWPAGIDERPIPEPLVQDAVKRFGYRVLPRP